MTAAPTASEIRSYNDLLEPLAQKTGYALNTDIEFRNELLKGLLINKARYGYAVCPCRLASGSREKDKDIICPCAYRKADIEEYGNCYCGLYMSKEAAASGKSIVPIPERRPFTGH